VSNRGSTYFDKEETMPEFLKLIARDPFNFLAHFEKCSTIALNDMRLGKGRLKRRIPKLAGL